MVRHTFKIIISLIITLYAVTGQGEELLTVEQYVLI